MLELPKIPYKMEKNQRQSVALRGINFSNMINDGDIVDSKNISARAYPYLTTRKSRASMGDYSGVTAMTVFRDKFVVVKGNKLIYDGKEVGTVLPGEKQFATINTKLCIMPDKKYLDGETLTLHDMGAEIFSKGATFTESSVSLDEVTYSVAKGRGSFLGNTFTSGKDLIWKYGVTREETSIRFWAEGKVNAVTPTKLALYDFPDDLKSKLRGQTLCTPSGTMGSGFTIWTTQGKIVDTADDGRFYVVLNSNSNLVGQGDKTTRIYFGDIIKSGDELTYSLENGRVTDKEETGNVSEEVTRAIATSPFGITASVSQRVDYDTSKIYREILTDLTTLFEIGWAVNFSGNSSGIITEVTPNTISIDKSFSDQNDVDTDITRGGDISELKAGDFVTISNSANNNITFGIDKIEGNKIYTENEIFTEGDDSNVITVERKIPDFDFICESNNRLWGCVNAEHTIYASALGDPTNFFDYSGESTDSWAVAVGSEGDFTACCRYGGAVLFFKEMKLHKVLGSYPAEYSLYDYEIEGVQSGSNKSLSIINEVLYYKGIHGVFAFNGSPHLISQNFGDKEFGKAVAGNDGDTYYISMSDGEREYLFAYETKYDMWLLEDDKRVKDFARRGGNTYALCEGGEFFLCGTGDSETDIEWFVQFAPLYETIDGKKSYSRIVFRLEIPRGSYLIVDVKTDDGAWREAGKVIGKRDGIVPVSIPINRCDKFELRLRGKGKATIHSMMREFFVGGDK